MATKKPAAKKSVRSAKAVESAPADAAPSPSADVPTPEQRLKDALALVEQANQTMELGVFALQDAVPLFKAMDEVTRAQRVPPIQDFLAKAQFAITSLIDELKITNGLPPDAKRPVKPLEIPPTMSAVDEAVAQVTLDQLKTLKAHYDVAVGVIGHHDVAVKNAEQALATLKFFAEQRRAVGLAIVQKGGSPE